MASASPIRRPIRGVCRDVPGPGCERPRSGCRSNLRRRPAPDPTGPDRRRRDAGDASGPSSAASPVRARRRGTLGQERSALAGTRRGSTTAGSTRRSATSGGSNVMASRTASPVAAGSYHWVRRRRRGDDEPREPGQRTARLSRVRAGSSAALHEESVCLHVVALLSGLALPGQPALLRRRGLLRRPSRDEPVPVLGRRLLGIVRSVLSGHAERSFGPRKVTITATSWRSSEARSIPAR